MYTHWVTSTAEADAYSTVIFDELHLMSPHYERVKRIADRIASVWILQTVDRWVLELGSLLCLPFAAPYPRCWQRYVEPKLCVRSHPTVTNFILIWSRTSEAGGWWLSGNNIKWQGIPQTRDD